ncbi:G patch domain and ankyrin repeat-containing protein 1 [Mortierella sp. AD031]|nr:G patch domain and ankyrin repeat-containing protein 1 [Mortierella sp. AD031]
MTQRTIGNNRVLRQDDSGTYYKDIVFVPSGALTMDKAASNSSTPSSTRKDDANEIREFYKSVLAMPKSEAQPVRRKKNVVKQVSSRAPTETMATKSEVQYSSGSSSTSESTATPLQTTSTAAPSTQPTQHSIPCTVPSKFTDEGATAGTPSTPSTPGSIPVTSDEIVRRNWSYSSQSGLTTASSSSSPASLSPPTRIVAEGYVLCEPCQMEVRKDDLNRHRRGTAHLMSQESPIKPIDALTLGHENKGFRMLVNSGWEYEKGLGAEGQGARHPVATRLKHDRLALGAVGTSKKLVTHTFEEIEQSRTKPATAKSKRRVPLSAEDYRKKAEKERRDRVHMLMYMKK